MTRRIVPVSADPARARIVAEWLVAAFGGIPEARTPDAMAALILTPGEGETLLLLDGDEPAGTASLAPRDLPSRPDLSPWLAGVFVRPEFRGRGHAAALVREVERIAALQGVRTLWLYTSAAQGLYARLGWQEAGEEHDPQSGKGVRLMRRDL